MDGSVDHPDPGTIGSAMFVELRRPSHLSPGEVELVLDVQFDADPYLTTVVVEQGSLRPPTRPGQELVVRRTPSGAVEIVGTATPTVQQCAHDDGRGSPAPGGPRS